jgi:hypothetical protein
MKVGHLYCIVALATMTALLGTSCRRSQDIPDPTTKAIDHAQPAGADAQAGYPVLPKPGAKVQIDADASFTYGFTKPPKLGTAIMKVAISTRDGKKDTSFIVRGDVDMPSMRGAHSTGDKDFSISAKGEYLLPVPLVMPGDWEFRFTFLKGGKTVFRGAYLFDL